MIQIERNIREKAFDILVFVEVEVSKSNVDVIFHFVYAYLDLRASTLRITIIFEEKKQSFLKKKNNHVCSFKTFVLKTTLLGHAQYQFQNIFRARES